MEPTDHELLAAFREKRCERSFRQLVTRHAAMVFATARRITGDPHRAEEISQAVFLLLAKNARELAGAQLLAGWLYHTTRHHSLDFIRSEARRQHREQLAADMQAPEPSAGQNPLTADLEAALADLQPAERDVLVLRYLEDRQLRDVGGELGISERAAQERVERALDRLREIFGRRGVRLTSGALITLLAGEASAGVPAGLISTVTTAAVAGSGAAVVALSTTREVSTIMNLFNLKTAAAILGAAAVTGTTIYLVQEREADRLRADFQTLNETHGKLAAEQQEARELIQLRDEQIELLKRDVAELPRLRGEVDGLNRRLVEADGLRAENEMLKRELAAISESKAHNSSVKPAAPGRLITREQLAFVGYATPEAALQSVTWAMLFGSYDQVIEGFSPEIAAIELKDSKGRESFSESQLQLAPLWQSMQIITKRTWLQTWSN